MRTHRIAAIGLASWDELLVTDHLPEAGSYAIVRSECGQPGGTTANTAVALARLGASVTVAAMVGDDPEGVQLRESLVVEGCDVRHVRTRTGEPTDKALIIVSGSGAMAERTILWRQGARLSHGDFLPIEELFGHDLVIVDVDDLRLRQLLVDLPMHVSPRTRLLGTLTYLVELQPAVGLDLALRHDYLVGNERELRYLTGATNLSDAIEALQDQMILSQTRFAVISRGATGCTVVDPKIAHEVPTFSVDAVDATGAGDAFAAGVALGILGGWDLRMIGRFANAVGALATTGLGARAGLPSRETVDALIETASHREGDG